MPAAAGPVRQRTKRAQEPPKPWPNGAAVYKSGTAHLKDDSGLLGWIVRQPDSSYGVWKSSKHGPQWAGSHPTHWESILALY